MSVALLDVNVLVSLFWDEHPHHAVCSEWFSQHQHAGWATCPLTEAGCARIMSNPAFSVRAPSFGEVVALLRQAAESSKTHQFWPANLPITALAALEYANLGHQQITDAYLLTLAVRRGGQLVTTDPRIRETLALGTHRESALVVLSL